MKLIPMTCPKCGATMELDKRKEYIKCQYCGETYYISKDCKKQNSKHNRVKRKVNVNIDSDGIIMICASILLILWFIWIEIVALNL